MNKVAFAFCIAIILPSISIAQEQKAFALAGWTKVTEGVYEQVDANGNVTRRAFGAEGAAYDRSVLESEVTAAYKRIRSGYGTENDEDLIASREEVLDGLFQAVDHIRPFATDAGAVCGRWAYAFDSHLVVGKAGATAVARTAFSTRQPGPPIALYSGSFYASATVTPNAGSAITSSQSATLTAGAVPVLASAQWRIPGLPTATIPNMTSGSCSASTFASVLVSAGVGCVGSNYASQTKSYATCVSAP